MTTRRSTSAFVMGIVLTTAIATILALLPAGSILWSSFAAAVAVPILLVVVLALAVIRMTLRGTGGLPLSLDHHPTEQ